MLSSTITIGFICKGTNLPSLNPSVRITVPILCLLAPPAQNNTIKNLQLRMSLEGVYPKVAALEAMYFPQVLKIPACPPPYFNTAYPPVINLSLQIGIPKTAPTHTPTAVPGD